MRFIILLFSLFSSINASFYNLSLEDKDKYLGDFSYQRVSDEEQLIFGYSYPRSQTPYIRNTDVKKIDYRNINNKNYISPAKDQGMCGSCVAFTATALLESIYLMNNTIIDLSEKDLFFCKGKRDCFNGWYLSSVSNVLKYDSIVSENCCPYDEGGFTCCHKYCNNDFKIDDYEFMTDINQIKDWIVKEGPVMTTFKVYLDFYSYKYGIYEQKSSNYRGSHSVLIVGFDDIHHYWIAKNSWGPDWGENGFFKIKYNEANIMPYAYGFILNEIKPFTRVERSSSNNLISNLILLILCMNIILI